MQFSYLFSGDYQDGLFHFFVEDDLGTREISKQNFWKWIDYFGLRMLGHETPE